ncbi:MAG: cation:proton antiporter [Opitutaceae bacterium]|nr:cation:proton antiporter [Opitutaceae bacterium]
MEDVHFIQNLALILLCAVVAGWICQRIGLSVIAGYLVAGIVLGPHVPPGGPVRDAAHIETLGQMGLVFLMFGLGLRLSIRRLRRSGAALLLAVSAGAAAVYYVTRLAAAVIGFSPVEGIFLAAMLMVSSSVIVGKIVREAGCGHERAARTALDMTALEDVVAVVMLTLSGVIAGMGGLPDAVPDALPGVAPGVAPGARVGGTLGRLGAFVALAGAGGLLFVPWLLRKLGREAGEELPALAVTGLLFGLAVVALHSGYSLALGAFLLGLIVAETPYRARVERTMEGMRDVFTAVFFVAVGLSIDLRLVADEWWLILVVAAVAVVARVAGVAVALAVTGGTFGGALRTGLMLTPLGEFSFVIAQAGVAAQVLPERFYPMIVGVALVTTLAAPWLTRNAERVSGAVLRWCPRWLSAWQDYYCARIEALRAQERKSALWQVSKRRIVQVLAQVLLVSGLLVFSVPLHQFVEQWLDRDWPFPHASTMLFWLVMVVVVVGPLVALWRNVSALCLLYAQAAVRGAPRAARLRPVVEMVFKAAVGIAMCAWLSMVLPAGPAARWVMLGSLAPGLLAFVLLRRRLVRWHSEMEAGWHSVVQGASARLETVAPWLVAHEEWDVHMVSCTLPDLAECGGRSIAELDLRGRFGCMVAGVERQGCAILHPRPEMALFPLDRVLLIGSKQQLEQGRRFLMSAAGGAARGELDEVRMEVLAVPAGSGAGGRTLRELSPAQRHRVQIVGVRGRAGARLVNPGGGTVLHAGDVLLVIGASNDIASFGRWLEVTGAPERGVPARSGRRPFSGGH